MRQKKNKLKKINKKEYKNKNKINMDLHREKEFER